GQIFGTDNVYIYDIPSNSWSFGPKLPAVRAAGNLVAVGTKLHYFGGQNLARTLDTPDHWVLDTANLAAGWTRLASMPLARNHAAALNIDGQIWVFGGQTGYDNNLVTRREGFRYDPSTNVWTTMSWQLPEGRSHTGYSTHYARGKVIMVAGERAHNSIVRTVWSIDVNAGTVASLNLFPEARISPAGAFVGGRLWMAGGYNGSIRTDAYWGDFI
ncbi:MAG TPA: hypothetical protein PKB10_00920, partial [Tepidisphaeraceae bacterium]|nr:hypothetical protein [Tepidisphaeraceae bacterium]